MEIRFHKLYGWLLGFARTSIHDTRNILTTQCTFLSLVIPLFVGLGNFFLLTRALLTAPQSSIPGLRALYRVQAARPVTRKIPVKLASIRTGDDDDDDVDDHDHEDEKN